MIYVYTSFLLHEYAAAGDFRKSQAYSNPLVRVQISVLLCLRTRIALYIHYNVMRDRLRKAYRVVYVLYTCILCWCRLGRLTLPKRYYELKPIRYSAGSA